MAFISLRQMLDHAAEHGYGVPAFNVNNLEQIQAIMELRKPPTARSSCRLRPGRASMRVKPTCAT
jgi:fructose/tagatose bisphosphate aldolase